MLVPLSSDDFEKFFPQCAEEPVPKSPYMSRTDWRAIARICRLVKPKRVLEIGTAWGDTTLWLAKQCPDADILTIGITREMDVLALHPEETKSAEEAGKAFKGTPEEKRIRMVFADSHTLSVEHLFPAPFGLILIDGNHDYEHVMHDTMIALKIVDIDRGAIIWHDCTNEPGVRKAIENVRYHILHVDHTQCAYLTFGGLQ